MNKLRWFCREGWSGIKLSLPAFKQPAIVPSLPKSHPRIDPLLCNHSNYSLEIIFLSGKAAVTRAMYMWSDKVAEISLTKSCLKAHVFTGLRRMKISFKEAVKFTSASDHESLTIFTCTENTFAVMRNDFKRI